MLVGAVCTYLLKRVGCWGLGLVIFCHQASHKTWIIQVSIKEIDILAWLRCHTHCDRRWEIALCPGACTARVVLMKKFCQTSSSNRKLQISTKYHFWSKKFYFCGYVASECDPSLQKHWYFNWTSEIASNRTLLNSNKSSIEKVLVKTTREINWD